MNYVELHLTDHCNLNCKGCGHFCPLAEEWFACLEQHVKDMKQLSTLFSNIRQIRLMGGEPLLHPQAASFLSATRQWFPASDIRLVTNGILLPKMPDLFWTACQSNRISIDITIYPPLGQRATEWVELVRQKEIPVYFATTEKFHAHMNLHGNSDPQRAFDMCRSHFYCPFLRDGRLYLCCIPALAHHFNKQCHAHIPDCGFVDIYQPGLTGWDALEILHKPAEACSYCSCQFPSYPWAVSERDVKEWDVSTYLAR